MTKTKSSLSKKQKRIEKRYAAEKRFQFYGAAAISFGVFSLVFLLFTICSNGYTAFQRTVIELDVTFDGDVLDIYPPISEEALEDGDYYTVAQNSIFSFFPGVSDRKEKRELKNLLSSCATYELRDLLLERPELLNETIRVELTASSALDQIHKRNAPRDIEESRRLLTNNQLDWYDKLQASGRIHSTFNWLFFTHGDSSSPEQAGIGGAILGSIFTLLVCVAFSFPIGVAAAVYLEEFSPKNRLSEFIEVNINNLAAVPSIIYGLLGLAIILNFFGLPRSTPLVGGIVLGLMTLPTIIIACRASLKAVPPSIREGALAVGASPTQVVLHHVLPLALPGTLTGTIIGLARALGETAPLLMIGMVAFIVDIPKGIFDSAAVLPVQIYLWAENAERGFVEKTSAAIMVILVFLVLMNLVAIYFRNRFERRW